MEGTEKVTEMEIQPRETHAPSQSDGIVIDPDHRLEKVHSRRSRTIILQTIKRENGAEPFAEPSASSDVAQDDVTHYRNLNWWQAGLIMVAETISLGILSLPTAMKTLGLVPGVIIILTFGVISTYTGYTIGQFKRAYPWIHTFADAAEIVGSPFGLATVFREFVGAAQVLLLIFGMGSHILTWTICMNTITGHPACTIIWSVVGIIILYVLSLPRTLKSVSWISLVSCISILTAVLMTIIGVGVNPPPDRGTIVIANSTASFASAFGAITNIVFAFSGHPAYFQFISELRSPKDFTKSLAFLQIFDTTLYLIAAIVIYYYSGDAVKSPAIGSVGHTLGKVTWGIAIPTILIAAIIYAHVSAKYIYVRALRNTRHLAGKTFIGLATWAGTSLTLWILAWIVAESIPVFNDLLGLIASLFISWFAYGLPAIFWLFLNWDRLFIEWRKTVLTVLNGALVLMAILIMAAGMFAVGVGIAADASKTVWSCANNAD